MKEKLCLPEVWCKIALVFLFGAFYTAAIPYPEKAREFPQLLAGFSLVMTVISLIVDFARKGVVSVEIGDVDDTELKPLDEGARALKRVRFYKASAIVAISTAAGFLGGFLFTTFFLFVGFALFFGPREKLLRNAVVAVAVTALVYVSFDKLMAVPLLEGLLW